MTAKALFVPLKTAYFEAFECGEKRTEYRIFGPRWNFDTCYRGRRVTLSHGYSGRRLSAVVGDCHLIYARDTPYDLWAPNILLLAIEMVSIRPIRRHTQTPQ